MINELIEKLNIFEKEYFYIQSTFSLLYFDYSTKLPKQGVEFRIEQMSYFENMLHQKTSSKEFETLINNLNKNFEKLEIRDKKRVEIWLKKINKTKYIPEEFITKHTKQIGKTNSSWEDGRKNNNSKEYINNLKKLMELNFEKINYLKKEFNFENNYDYFLDEYEENMTSFEIKNEFDKLKEFLIKSLKKIKNSSNFIDKPIFNFNILNEKEQEEITQFLINKIIPNENRFRYLTTTHPFTIEMGMNDIAITTAFRENLYFSISSTIHECGHALYELGLKNTNKWSCLNEAPSMGIHESQSRFWENNIGESKYFLDSLYNEFKKKFPKSFEKITKDMFYNEINRIRPGLQRLEADELTYGLHIIIRFELEYDLFNKHIEIENIEEEWNNKYLNYFGLKPNEIKDGFMQDVHWSENLFGYFPTYILGSIWSSMILEKIKLDFGENKLNKLISNFDFNEIREWLNENIYKHGKQKSAKEIIKILCGEDLNSDIYINYLKEKYSKIYNLKL